MSDGVFISSTTEDLEEYRAAARDVCLRLGLLPVAMETFGAMGSSATPSSLEREATAAVFVGIVAHRYGHRPDDGELSVTHAEYRHADELGLKRLCFLIDPDHRWPGRSYDEDRTRLNRFKAEIDRETVRVFFTTVENFALALTASLVNWRDSRAVPSGPSRRRSDLRQDDDQFALTGPERMMLGRKVTGSLPVLLDAYRCSVPPPAHTDELRSLEKIIERLHGLAFDSTDVPPVLRFVIGLEQRATSETQRDGLRRLVDRYARRLQLDEEIIADLRAEISEQLQSRRPADYLLVCIDEQPASRGSNRYLLTVVLHRGGGDAEPLTAGDDDACLSLDELRNLVCATVTELAPTFGDDLVVEFLVPRDLFDEEFDRWRIGETPLGMKYGVLVRDLDRTKASEPNQQWLDRWKLLNTGDRATSTDGLQWIESPTTTSVESLEAFLRRTKNWACLGFPRFSVAENTRALLDTGLELGAPAVLWLRTGSPSGDQTLQQLKLELEKTPLPDFPAKILDLRREASERDAADHCGRFVVLLWDDPDRVPTRGRPLAVPTQRD